MSGTPDFDFGLGSIPMLRDLESRSNCAENPEGKQGAGGQVANELGPGWKGRPCLTLKPGETATLADVEGPGLITHMWFTMGPETEAWDEAGHRMRRYTTVYRDIVLRIYWDGQKAPSVEVPIGDFFCNGHAVRCNILSLPINVNPAGGFNSYWPMPFAKHCKITVENQIGAPLGGFFYQISYALGPVPKDAAYFHASWRREDMTEYLREYTIVDGIKGRGHYVGTYMAWTQLTDGWWGEGEIKFFMDGDKKFPTIIGTGTEDYFGGAWGFGEQTFSAPYLGYPYFKRETGQLVKHGLYRWHVMDPIRFKKDLRVVMQALGWSKRGQLLPLRDDIASVAYWYQTLPHKPFQALREPSERWPR
jgi:hypothetical protein